MVDTRRDPAHGSLEKAARKPTSHTVFSLSEGETYELGQLLARQLEGGEIVLLEGPLGVGKTVLARGLAAGLGIPPEEVSSPTFTLVQEYSGGRLTLYHVDLFRIDDPQETASLGLEDLVASRGIVLVEWGDRLPLLYRREALTIRMHHLGEGSRRIEILADATVPGGTESDA